MLRSVVTVEVEVIPVAGFGASVRGLSGENGDGGIARWEDLKGAGWIARRCFGISRSLPTSSLSFWDPRKIESSREPEVKVRRS